jgi:hypothetical protein
MDSINFKMMQHNLSNKDNSNIKNEWDIYTQVYIPLFRNLKPKRIFELGLCFINSNVDSNMGPNVRTGASLYGWNEYFPDAEIYGADIDSEFLISTEKIKKFYCDKTNIYSIEKLWKQHELQDQFDIIIDDGLHSFKSIIIFFENSIHKLRTRGYFCIENVRTDQLDQWEKIIQGSRQIYLNFQFQIFRLDNILNKNDNNMIIIHKIK